MDFYATIPALQAPYTIVAGICGPRGVLSPFGMELNDGIVALNETRLSDQDRIVQLDVWHTFMMNDRAVQETVLQCLQEKSLTQLTPPAAPPSGSERGIGRGQLKM
jgi:hypothetical protein